MKTIILVLTLTVLTIVACGLAYESTSRANKYLRDNEVLIESIVTGDAVLDIRVNKRGDLWIRVNGQDENVHIFPRACRLMGLLTVYSVVLTED